MSILIFTAPVIIVGKYSIYKVLFRAFPAVPETIREEVCRIGGKA